MLYALNRAGFRIDACEADRDNQYFCPICGNHVSALPAAPQPDALFLALSHNFI